MDVQTALPFEQGLIEGDAGKDGAVQERRGLVSGEGCESSELSCALETY